MKKITSFTLILTIIMALCVVFAGCNNTTQTDTATHTLPPTQATLAEPEWAEVLCDIALFETVTNTAVLAGDDFETFALVGSNDTDSYITLKISENGANTIKSAQSLLDLQLVINGDTVADIVIDPATFTGEITFGEDMAFESLCKLASSIRGLY